MDKPMRYSDLDKRKLWTESLEDQSKRNHFNDINPLILEYLQTNRCQGTLLDLGCGSGHMSNLFNEIGFRVTGVDGDYKRIEKAKSKYSGIDFKCYTIKSTLPFEDNSFDVLFSRSVFQYFEHESILKECKRILKKNGSIIMFENLRNNPITRIGRAYLKLTNHKYHSYPWNHFTLSEISKLSEDFENSSLHFFHLLSPLSFLKVFKKYYPVLFRIDQKLLRMKFLRNFAWLVLFTAKNK